MAVSACFTTTTTVTLSQKFQLRRSWLNKKIFQSKCKMEGKEEISFIFCASHCSTLSTVASLLSWRGGATNQFGCRAMSNNDNISHYPHLAVARTSWQCQRLLIPPNATSSVLRLGPECVLRAREAGCNHFVMQNGYFGQKDTTSSGPPADRTKGIRESCKLAFLRMSSRELRRMKFWGTSRGTRDQMRLQPLESNCVCWCCGCYNMQD